MKRNQKGEVVMLTAAAYLVLAFVGIIAASKMDTPSQPDTVKNYNITAPK